MHVHFLTTDDKGQSLACLILRKMLIDYCRCDLFSNSKDIMCIFTIMSNCSMFCCMLLYVHSSIAIILMGKRELVALLNLSSWCLIMAERLFLMVPGGCLQFVILVFPDHTHLLFLYYCRCQTQQSIN